LETDLLNCERERVRNAIFLADALIFGFALLRDAVYAQARTAAHPVYVEPPMTPKHSSWQWSDLVGWPFYGNR
jgi:hypothetical protein